VQEPAPAPPPEVPLAIARLEGSEPGPAAVVVCPLCQGRLSEVDVGGLRHYACHVGHHFSDTSLVAEQADEVERALWAATRALEESEALSRRLAEGAPEAARRRFLQREAEASQNAALLRRVLLGGRLPAPTDAPVLVPGRKPES
jgi:two-component system chemotaxis response regulator CheB